MLSKLKFGLFKLDITDHYAILGIPINCDPKQIRLKYLKVAQRLHPDTFTGQEDEKNMAKKIFTNMVNPSYEKISKERNRKEFNLILWEKGKKLSEESFKITFASDNAKKLLQADEDYESIYNQLFESIAKNQYTTIKESLVKIAQLSELNLVYLILKEGFKTAEANKKNGKKPEKSLSKPANSGIVNKNNSNNDTKNQPIATKTPKETELNTEYKPESKYPRTEEEIKKVKLDSYINRAQNQIAKENYTQAILELRDAIKIDPSNSTSHACMGIAYLKQNQIPMARVHIKKASELNPKDPKAKEAQEELAKLESKTKKKSPKGKAKDQAEKKETKVFGIKLW